jgi:7,8-dihydroneopterin aldolase/epimerase/oxygenase
MGLITLENMEFFAYHGCYEAEQIVGNKFIVNLTLQTDLSLAAKTDQLKDALNYQQAYEIVKKQMLIRSNLLEHIAKQIVDGLYEAFPQLTQATVKVSKLYPPLGGQVKSVSVEFSR